MRLVLSDEEDLTDYFISRCLPVSTAINQLQKINYLHTHCCHHTTTKHTFISVDFGGNPNHVSFYKSSLKRIEYETLVNEAMTSLWFLLSHAGDAAIIYRKTVTVSLNVFIVLQHIHNIIINMIHLLRNQSLFSTIHSRHTFPERRKIISLPIITSIACFQSLSFSKSSL